MTQETRSFPPHDPTIVTMGRKPNPDKCHELAETIERDGQLQPGLCALVPAEWHTLPPDKLKAVQRSYIIDPRDFTAQTRFINIAGNRRMTASWLKGLDYQARVLDVLPPPIEAVRMGWHENESRQKMTVYERADYLDAIRRAMPGATLDEVAKAVNNANPSSISLELQPKNIPEDWRPRTEGLNQTVIRFIGGIKKREHMDAAITFACGGGTPATQAQVKEFIKRQKKTVGRKAKYLEGKLDGKVFKVELLPGETAEQAAKRLLVILKRLRKQRNAPAESLGYLFA